ncbi:uncharacterized protein LOC121378819 [Gigantopelta aegis]|uniref:uncharacterized protein LOC121378819 n=1 Tax=Gigantopelta aegis TaxID=1735272 RepID=UPI001B88D747|nr:uncharacterized protein LOC121378819 [Gigantopelta aegis]
MKCRQCNREKLRQEFPPEDLTEDCMHPRFYCMRCVVSTCKKTGVCPHPGCDQPVPADGDVIKLLEYTLAEMFKEYPCEYSAQFVSEDSCTRMIRIAVLNGDSITLPFNPEMTVFQLKEQIKTKLGHDIKKQQLIYKDVELQMYANSGGFSKLADHNIAANSTIYLAVTLFDIPSNLDHVIFDLHWGYPERYYYEGSHGPKEQTLQTRAVGDRAAFYIVNVPYDWCVLRRYRDFLDASCLVYKGKQFLKVYDFHPEHQAETTVCKGVVTHTGDKMDDFNKVGHHTIEVSLQQLPPHVTHLFFTLSGWNYESIKAFPDLSLKFYDARAPEDNLCETKLAGSVQKRAVIMCCVSRSSKGWKILECGKTSEGYADDYEPIKKTIRTLFDLPDI